MKASYIIPFIIFSSIIGWIFSLNNKTKKIIYILSIILILPLSLIILYADFFWFAYDAPNNIGAAMAAGMLIVYPVFFSIIILPVQLINRNWNEKNNLFANIIFWIPLSIVIINAMYLITKYS
jgi:biotin transporter BioY